MPVVTNVAGSRKLSRSHSGVTPAELHDRSRALHFRYLPVEQRVNRPEWHDLTIEGDDNRSLQTADPAAFL